MVVFPLFLWVRSLLVVRSTIGSIWAKLVLLLREWESSRIGSTLTKSTNSIQWDIHRIQARGATMTGGLYNVSLRGTGYVAVTTKGDPIALDVASSPTFADAQAVVLWTSGVSMDIRVDTGGLGSMIRGGTGELLQMAFGGQGYVLVQPSESVPQGGHQSGGQTPGGMLGQFMQ